ncbi:MAG TPA: glycine/sarcosine/betaine reductase component B subunit [Acidimicrobiales bacterium]|jgi:glycine reductase|nr:glycine/sarcosine/betaine reductase component B subunit [Acidimicrobiales bacterium]
MADMPENGLTRLVHHVTEVATGPDTTFADGRLTVSADAARQCLADPALARIEVTWASPGQSVRIVKVLDAVEPRTKGAGGGGIFAGFVGPDRVQGRGSTHVLRGAAVVVAGFLPRAQEAVVEMSGPAAALSPLGATHNLVVEFTPTDDAPWEDVDRALRRGALRLAVHLADAALDAPPDAEEWLPAPAPPTSGADGRYRVGAITNLQTQGTFKDVFVYGRSFSGGLPTLVDPGDLDDGAVVSGQFGHPSLKNPTFMHQNHPVVAALRARHGVDVDFAGVVISPEPVVASQKELVSAHAARLCAAAGWDAAIVTKEGGGNADGDVALKMDALEDAGVTAVGLFAEMAGPDGTGPPIVVPPERATAMVSTGNYDERLVLPAVERAFGGNAVALVDRPATDELQLPMAVVYCALSPLGWGHLTCAPELGTEELSG